MPTLDLLPHPISAEGRETLEFDLIEDVTLERLLDGVRDDVWEQITIVVDGEAVNLERRRQVMVRQDTTIQLRALTHGGGGSNPLALILSVAVLIAAPYLAGALLPGITGGLLAGATALIGAAGLFIVNTLFPVRAPSLGDEDQPERQYSLSAGSNPVRIYEPLGLVLGQHRIFPDFAARPYTELITQSTTNTVPEIGPVTGTTPVDVPDLDYTNYAATDGGHRRP